MDGKDQRAKTVKALLRKTRYAILTLRARDRVYERLLQERLDALEKRRARMLYASDKEIRDVRELFREVLLLDVYNTEDLADRIQRQKGELLTRAEICRSNMNKVSFISLNDPEQVKSPIMIVNDNEGEDDEKHSIHVCKYGSEVGGPKCRYYPCITPPNYRVNMGFTKLLTPELTGKDESASESKKDDPKYKRTKKVITSIAKEQSLNKVMNEIKRHNLEKKPKQWVTNYGTPTPLRLINKPPRV